MRRHHRMLRARHHRGRSAVDHTCCVRARLRADHCRPRQRAVSCCGTASHGASHSPRAELARCRQLETRRRGVDGQVRLRAHGIRDGFRARHGGLQFALRSGVLQNGGRAALRAACDHHRAGQRRLDDSPKHGAAPSLSGCPRSSQSGKRTRSLLDLRGMRNGGERSRHPRWLHRPNKKLASPVSLC